MNCEIGRRMMDMKDPALAAHLRSCPSCIIQTRACYYQAPPGLEQKIRQSLLPVEAKPWVWRSVAIAAALLLAASVTWNIALLRSRVDPQRLLAVTVLSAHVRSLAGTHLLDVPSSDQHTVKPFFNGKLDFSPSVKEVPGFPLLGGRVEYFDGHSAAALVYGRRKHIINLFTWPSPDPIALSTRSINGYHVACWSGGGMDYCTVSDLNETELKQFADSLRQDEK